VGWITIASARRGVKSGASWPVILRAILRATREVFDSPRPQGRLRGTGAPPRHPPFAILVEPPMPVMLKTSLLLVLSNVFMTFAWYGHLKTLGNKAWYVAALISWGIALFEYLLQVPANRIGYTQLSLGQLKILQEVIAIGVFVPFAIYYMKQPPKLDFLWAGCCLLGAVYFVFRNAPVT
jgi:uncharacterized protein (DUF486 family)